MTVAMHTARCYNRRRPQLPDAALFGGQMIYRRRQIRLDNRHIRAGLDGMRNPWNCNLMRSLTLASVGVFLAALTGCGHGVQAETSAGQKKHELPTLKAAVMTVELRPSPVIVRTQGSLIADDVTIVGAKVAGRINAVTVDLGDVVA